MVSLLIRLFVKNRENTSDPEVRRKYGEVCGFAGILLNVLLFAGKFIAGQLSGSIAIMADAFNNLSDAGSSVITLIGFRLAGRKPDPDHPFGHGRIEYISGLVVAAIIILMGFELVKSSVEKIINPQPVDASAIVLIILAASIVVKLYMSFYNRRYGKKINSSAMIATAADSLSDCISTVVVLVSALVARFAGIQIDGWCGLLVGIFVFIAGCKAINETISPLLGQPPEKEFVENIENIVLSYEQVSGVHDLVVHDYGPGRRMISLHAEVDAQEDILAIHDVIDNIEVRLRKELDCEAVIHMDPVVNNEETRALKEMVHGIVKGIDSVINMHDFRAVPGETHTNLIFDIVVPFKYSKSDEELRNTILAEVRKIRSDCNTVVQIDRDYVSGK
ncbi:MAG: cation transporter [Clostridia bacterium]|nr:cation transporter [Oscillospiraceae bacterium]MBQ6797221.1 cation transporter [Clostridia bacterium]